MNKKNNNNKIILKPQQHETSYEMIYRKENRKKNLSRRKYDKGMKKKKKNQGSFWQGGRYKGILFVQCFSFFFLFCNLVQFLLFELKSFQLSKKFPVFFVIWKKKFQRKNTLRDDKCLKKNRMEKTFYFILCIVHSRTF